MDLTSFKCSMVKMVFFFFYLNEKRVFHRQESKWIVENENRERNALFFDDDWSSDMMYRVERFIHKCATTQHFG